jgi:hypothetical protein
MPSSTLDLKTLAKIVREKDAKYLFFEQLDFAVALDPLRAIYRAVHRMPDVRIWAESDPKWGRSVRCIYKTKEGARGRFTLLDVRPATLQSNGLRVGSYRSTCIVYKETSAQWRVVRTEERQRRKFPERTLAARIAKFRVEDEPSAETTSSACDTSSDRD